ncbi:hypothetical protein GIB67_031211 [Kingdonia uniflora]|uniref:Uncharacterized protein n=1 Tax=Kingdonia uniflora TaxID=39325 RepID=A0A7J7NL25_9MAGN|nr:hypothetical protein GIB67_031211 [Kingdonia uniflora]
MVKTRSQRAVKARALNDLRLALKIDELREAIFGQQGYDAVLLETRANYEDRKEFVMMMAREEIINEDKDIASGRLKGCGAEGNTGCFKYLVGRLSPVIRVGDEEDIVAELVEWPRLKGARVEYPMGCSRFREFCKAKSSVDGIWGHVFGYRGNFFRTCSVRQGGDYLYLLSDLAKEKKYRLLGDEVSLKYIQGVCYEYDWGLPQLNCNFWEAILVCETLNERWAASGSESRITAKDFLEYYAVNRASWNDNLLWVSGECLQRSDEEPLELNDRTITMGINRFKRVASKDGKVRRSQAKMRMAGKTPCSMEENMLTPELNTPLKLARLNEMSDGPVDMATMSNTVVRNLANNKAMKRGAASRSAKLDSMDNSESVKIAEGADLRPRFEFARALRGVQLGLQDRSIELEKRISQLEGEKNQFEESLNRERKAFQLELEKEREAAAQKLKEVRVESVAKAKRLVSASTTSQNNLEGKLYHLRYTKAEIMALNEGNYEEKEIVDEEEVEEMEDGMNVAEKTEIKSLCLRVVDLEGLLEVEKKSSADLQKELDVAKEREEQTLLYNTEYAEEYEALISQYEDQLDDNVKLSLKLKEAMSQVEDKTITLLSKDLALNQLLSELAELKERVASGSRHDAELAEYRSRALNDEISDMKCNIRALNEQLLKRKIDLDTTRTNLADFEKLGSSIVGKDLELSSSVQIRESLITRLDRLKADLHRLKERKAKSIADLAEVQAKNKSLVDDLAYVRKNVKRAVQRDKEMNERINQLCARINELERELRAREMKYEKDLKLELDKRDGEIVSGEGSREMNEFLRQKEELVENMRIDLINSWQKSIDLTW